MAERKNQRQVRCQNQYVYDRLSSEKVLQVYHWLVPEEPEPERTEELIVAAAGTGLAAFPCSASFTG
jgi:hypothetical protein